MRVAVLLVMAVILFANPCLAGPGVKQLPQPGVADVAAGESEEQPRTFYEDAKRGWWWSEDPTPVGEEKPEDRKSPKQKHRIPQMAEYPTEKLWSMHPKDFNALWEDFRDKAVQSPTDSNIKEYYIMTDVARLRARKFADVYTAFISTNPDLAMDMEVPQNTPGIFAKTAMQNNEMDTAIANNRSEYALLYFYSKDCSYCIEQDGIVKLFQGESGWEVKKVDINQNPDLADHFRVSQVPYLVLIYKHNTSDYLPVSAGVVALTALKPRIYRGLRVLRGESDPGNYTTYDFQKGSELDTDMGRWDQKQKKRGFLPSESGIRR